MFCHRSSNENEYHENLSTRNITENVFQKESALIKCEPTNGFYLAANLMYRGDVSPQDIYPVLRNLRKKQSFLRFADFCSTGFKIGITNSPPIIEPETNISIVRRNVSLLSNTTATNKVFSNIEGKFDKLYKKRAFVHWYCGADIGEDIFLEAKEEHHALMKEYIID